MPLLKVGVEDAVDLVGSDLELVVETGIAHVTLCGDEILDTLDHLGIVHVTKVITLDEASEVNADKVADSIDFGL